MPHQAAIDISHKRNVDKAACTQVINEVRLCMTAKRQLIDPTNRGEVVIAFGADR